VILEAYGQYPALRDWLEEHHVSYVLAVPKCFPAPTAARACARISSRRSGPHARQPRERQPGGGR